MTAKFWWKTREVWHGRETARIVAKPRILGMWAWRRYGWVCVRRDTATAGTLAWRRFRVLLPLGCNGNRGGWRTRFCEWLEQCARAKEEK